MHITLARESYIEGTLVVCTQCAYPGCREVPIPRGIVVTFVRDWEGTVEHRTYCCELHAAFALLEMAQQDLACLGPEDECVKMITEMVRDHLNGEHLLVGGQRGIDKAVDDILGDDSGPAA